MSGLAPLATDATVSVETPAASTNTAVSVTSDTATSVNATVSSVTTASPEPISGPSDTGVSVGGERVGGRYGGVCGVGDARVCRRDGVCSHDSVGRADFGSVERGCFRGSDRVGGGGYAFGNGRYDSGYRPDFGRSRCALVVGVLRGPLCGSVGVGGRVGG